jgi:hypothetical protein
VADTEGRSSNSSAPDFDDLALQEIYDTLAEWESQLQELEKETHVLPVATPELEP